MKHNGNVLKKHGNFTVIDCTNCGFIHIIPLPSKKEISKLYKKKYYADVKPKYFKQQEQEIDYWNTLFDKKIQYLETKIKTKVKSILDIGSGPGFFLKRAKERGWIAHGIEPNEIASNYSRKIGIPVVNDFFQNVDIKNMQKYDVINLVAVLEHVDNPIELLKRCYLLLKSKGIIAIESPNDYSPLQKIVQKSLGKKEYWLTIDPKARNYKWSSTTDHLNYFNFSSLKKLLKKMKFHVIYQQSTFPLELFLLMGDDYLNSDMIGKKLHQKRMNLEMNLMNFEETAIKKSIYEKFAELGIGRTMIIFAQK
jgi:2-polyprenyl-3-methyl-5-hydroxy-6-metoxy-1,4-benzoquinol methylase